MLDPAASFALWQWAQGKARVTRPDARGLLCGGAAWSRFGIRDPSLLSNPAGDPIVAANGCHTLYFNGRDAPIDRGGITQVGRASGVPSGGWHVDPRPVFADGAYAAQGSVVRVAPDDYRLYYNFDTSRGFALARSADGLVWQRMAEPAILRPEQFAASRIGLPHVTRHDNAWVMLFEGFVEGRAKLFLALSEDGLAWEPGNGGEPIYRPERDSWDAHAQANPSLVRLSPGRGAPPFAIIYNGENAADNWEIGALFADAIGGPWRGLPAPLLKRGPPGSWDGGRLEGGRVVNGRPAGLGMLFFGLPTADSYADGRIGFATIEPEPLRAIDK
jgi:hypothetical protein